MPTNLTKIGLIVSTLDLTYVLIAVSGIFIIFIGIAVFKMYRLKSEEKRLMETNAFKDSELEVKDYSGGHLYGDN
jgi:hypothetical protein